MSFATIVIENTPLSPGEALSYYAGVVDVYLKSDVSNTETNKYIESCVKHMQVHINEMPPGDAPGNFFLPLFLFGEAYVKKKRARILF